MTSPPQTDARSAAAIVMMAALVLGTALLIASPLGWTMPWAWVWFVAGTAGSLLCVHWWFQGRLGMKAVIVGAILFRLLMLPFPPLTSSDFDRYLWDGIVQHENFNPYQYLPSDPALGHLHALPEFERMNSPNYYSVYPPLSQVIFYLAASVRGLGFQAAYSLLKFLMMLPEIAGIFALSRLVKARDLMLYAWNPIIVIVIAGQGHTETAMVGLILVMLWASRHGKGASASLALAGAGLVKIYPFVLFPLLIDRFGWRKVWPGLFAAALISAAYFDAEKLGNFASSLRLYLSYFEFNAGPYFVLGKIGWKFIPGDPRPLVTAALAFTFAVSGLVMWWRHRRGRIGFEAATFIIFSVYLACGRTLHPWYLASVLCLLPLVRPAWRWPWLWLLAGAWGTYLFYVDRTYWPFVWIGWGGWAAGLLFAFSQEPAMRGRFDSVVQQLLRRRAAAKARMFHEGLAEVPSQARLRVLDLGAAEGYLGEEIARVHQADVHLVDIHHGFRSDLAHTVYDGVRLPFPQDHFDASVVCFVLHHAEDPAAILRELQRVTSRRVFIVESWARSTLLRRILVFVDRFANSLRGGGWDDPIAYRSLDEWGEITTRLGYRVISRRDLGGLFHAKLCLELEPGNAGRQVEKPPAFEDSAAGGVCRQTLVIIPALDESKTLPGVLDALRSWPLGGVRVVDNGSSDGTAKCARDGGAEVLHEPVKGYGSACWTGMRDIPAGIEWILFCDADGSDDLRELEPFFQAAADGHDLILGNRNALSASRAALTWPQRFGNALAGFLIALRWGVRFHDLGPLRLIRRSALENMAMEDRGFGWTVEMQAKAAMLRLRCLEIPVVYGLRKGGKSKIAGTLSGSVKAGSIILLTLGKLYLRKNRSPDPTPNDSHESDQTI